MKSSFRAPLGSSLLLLALSASLMAGCRAKTSLPGVGNGGVDMGKPVSELPVVNPSKPAPIMANPFTVTARSTMAEYQVGKPVELEIEVKNTSKYTAQLQFSSGQSFNFSATPKGEKEPVWNWAMDKMFTQALRSEKLEPGKSLEFKTTWDGAKAGTYLVTGTITANGGLDAPPFTLIVK